MSIGSLYQYFANKEEILEERREELRVPSPRLASVALAHGMSGTLHGIVESDLSLLYDESLESNLTDMVCAYLLRDDPDESAARAHSPG